MSLFRSEEMTLCQLFLQSEAAYACVSELGELGLVQFRDLNLDVNAFQRKFVNEVRRCDEMEHELLFLEKEIKKDEIPMLDTGENPEAPPPRDMIHLEETFQKLGTEFKIVNHNAVALKKNLLDIIELKHILRKTQVFFDEMTGSAREEEQVSLLGEEGLRAGGQSLKLGFVAGVILRERIPPFERMLWRACRGNVFLRQAEIETPLEDPSSGAEVFKSVFIIFFQGDQLKTRVKKICEGFRATLYPCPEAPAARREMAMSVMTRIEDLNTVIAQTQDHRHRVLVAAAKNIQNWLIKVRKIKAIYHTLNLFNFDVTQKCLIAECWVPVLDMDTIKLALRRGAERSGSFVPPILNPMETFDVPPTYNRTNKFTSGFQALIDSYGIANYREVNPAPYTIITFPFLFAVMFGDLGHGLIMFLVSGWMVLKEKPLSAKKSDNEVWNIMFGGRYIILLMGAFSMYTGLIYNDMFSKSFNIFGSSWGVSYTTKQIENDKFFVLNPSTTDYAGSPYPFGVDPIWQLAFNKIQFYNSLKMKLSIIIGVIQMLFGVCLSLWNHTYFKKPLNIITEFIPQIIFLCFLFLYLVLLMFIKWVTYFPTDNPEEVKYSPHCAPSILITFINMVLFKDTVVPEDCDTYMYSGQMALQKLLIIFALLCVPFMLFAKPYYIMRSRRTMNYSESRQQIQPGNGSGDAEPPMHSNTAPAHGGGGGHGEGDDLSELFIYQGIHTVEYVLGSVSHTASYLRLWALSLAHAQLSDVLWDMVLSKGFKFDSWVGGFALWFTFAAWTVLTVSILVLMEGLSAFLHTLRLHWVEFQSKFYTGAGYGFQPFAFKSILDSHEK